MDTEAGAAFGDFGRVRADNDHGAVAHLLVIVQGGGSVSALGGGGALVGGGRAGRGADADNGDRPDDPVVARDELSDRIWLIESPSDAVLRNTLCIIRKSARCRGEQANDD